MSFTVFYRYLQCFSMLIDNLFLNTAPMRKTPTQHILIPHLEVGQSLKHKSAIFLLWCSVLSGVASPAFEIFLNV